MTDKIAKVHHDVPAVAGDTLDLLLQKAVDSGAVDVLERLLAVRRQVQADRARDAFYTSLIAFQTACPVIQKSTTATIKPGFSYRYCPIEEIAHAIRPLLEQFQLGYRWFAAQQGNQLTVTCRISHALGHIEETSLTVPVGTDQMRPAWPVAQSLTYAKRYTLCNALGIVVGGEDDDAQEPVAEAPKRPAETTPAVPPQATPNTVAGMVEDVQVKSGTKGEKSWTKWDITINGETYGTFDRAIGEAAIEAKNENREITLEWKQDGKYKTGTDLYAVVDDVPRWEPGMDG